MKLIDKSALVAEIEKLKAYLQIPNAQLEAIKVCDNVISVINTLESKEVDLEEAINGLTCGWIEGEEYGELQNINTARCVTLEEVKEVMRCIYELGLKAQKGE